MVVVEVVVEVVMEERKRPHTQHFKQLGHLVRGCSQKAGEGPSSEPLKAPEPGASEASKPSKIKESTKESTEKEGWTEVAQRKRKAPVVENF